MNCQFLKSRHVYELLEETIFVYYEDDYPAKHKCFALKKGDILMAISDTYEKSGFFYTKILGMNREFLGYFIQHEEKHSSAFFGEVHDDQ